MRLTSCVLFALTIASFVELGHDTATLPLIRRGIVTLTAIGLLWSVAIGDDEGLAIGLVGYWLVMLTALRVTMLFHVLYQIARERWGTWRDVR
jgi:hypothetical protein